MSVKFLADENFKAAVVRGVLRQQPELDIVRVQDIGLRGIDDPKILEWTAQAGRVLLTHDVNTVTKFAYERLVAELLMPGVIEVRRNALIGQAIEDILLLSEFEEEYWGKFVMCRCKYDRPPPPHSSPLTPHP